MNCFIVYITCKTREEAKTIASAVIGKRLAACANIFPAHDSVYEWEGAVQSGAETAVIFKTTAEAFDDLKAEILKHHSYEVPCIVGWPAEKGHAPFLAWVGGAVS